MTDQLIVVYDANVLYPASLRDLLMHLAMTDLFRAKWSQDIHKEWMDSLLEDRPDLTRQQLERTRQLMDAHVRDCIVTGYQDLIDTLELPDRKDRHVLAAAIRSHANLIVTSNIKDFPSRKISQYSIRAIKADEFVITLLDLDRAKVLSAMERHQQSLKNPPKSSSEYLETLAIVGLKRTVSLIEKYTHEK